MSVGNNVRFNEEREGRYPRILPETSRVDLNNLMKRVREEEKKNKRINLTVSVIALSAAVMFGVILTL
mgnify:CR=1 FL=1